MKRQVLFVDDDQRLLSGLRRSLRALGDQWEMTFYDSPEEAIRHCERMCFDVVVSDMRMPGMDGGELLGRIREICPWTVRIILSGQSDLDSITRSIHPAHQYVSKPCEIERLREMVTRACYARDLLKPINLREFVSRIGKVTCQKAILHGLQRELQSDDPQLEIIEKYVMQDVCVSLKLLQLVNSAFFGSHDEVLSPIEAAGLLGIKVLRRLVFTAEVFESSKVPEIDDDLTVINRHCAKLAACARVAASSHASTLPLTDTITTAALFQDLGKVLLAIYDNSKYRSTVKYARDNGLDLVSAEYDLFGTDSAQVGAYMAGLWALPESIVEAILRQHDYQHASPTTRTILTCIREAWSYRNTEDQNPSGAWRAKDENKVTDLSD